MTKLIIDYNTKWKVVRQFVTSRWFNFGAKIGQKPTVIRMKMAELFSFKVGAKVASWPILREICICRNFYKYQGANPFGSQSDPTWPFYLFKTPKMKSFIRKLEPDINQIARVMRVIFALKKNDSILLYSTFGETHCPLVAIPLFH